MSLSTTSPELSYPDARFVLICDPRPGTVVELAPGSQLAVRFRRRLGASRWQVAGLPGHLLALLETGHEFQFLVFGCADEAVPLRLERRRHGHEMAHEVCELLVVPVTDRGARPSRPGSPRTA